MIRTKLQQNREQRDTKKWNIEKILSAIGDSE
jgi:hypothetical protein